MKYVYSIIFLLPMVLFSQYNHLKLEKEKVIYERVFEIDSMSKEDLKAQLQHAVSKINNIHNVQFSETFFSAELKNIIIDYKKYGYSYWKTPVPLNYPFSANVFVSFKEGKYRVTVSSMLFFISSSGMLDGPLTCETLLTKNGEKFKQNNTVIIGGEIIEKYLDETFTFDFNQNKEW